MEKNWDFSVQSWLIDSVRQHGEHQCVNTRFSTQHVVWDAAETHKTNCLCNPHARFMTNEARLKINLSQMRNDMRSYKGLDQQTNNTSAAPIKLSCLFFMTSWSEFKKKGNGPYLMAAKVSNGTCPWMSLERWKHSPADLVWLYDTSGGVTLQTAARMHMQQEVFHWTRPRTKHEPTDPSASVADPPLWPITSIYVSYLAKGSYRTRGQ